MDCFVRKLRDPFRIIFTISSTTSHENILLLVVIIKQNFILINNGAKSSSIIIIQLTFSNLILKEKQEFSSN